MDGVHDMGGMHGFGPVDVADDAQFHHDWERLVFGVDRVLRSEGVFNIDEKRHSIERLDPATYLADTYFERWLDSIELLLVERGHLAAGELDAAAGTEPEATGNGPSEVREGALAAFASAAAFDREPREPRFAADETVRVRNIHPRGHTRCPRYVRRSRGRIERVRGTYVLPDANAHGEERAEPLYVVAFDGDELWGDEAEVDTVYVDLWESYLEPADDDDD
jgi:nitrile hydratase beta subunit